MLIVDSLIIKGVRWVLGKVVAAVDAELNDDTVLRQRLLEAQMRHELGELSDEELAGIESDVMVRLREIQAARGGGGPVQMNPEEMKITGIEATFTSDEDEG